MWRSRQFDRVVLSLFLHLRLCAGSAGEVDLAFDPGSIGPGSPRDVLVQPNGGILIRGAFTEVQGVARPGIARLKPDGSLDATFDPGTGVKGSVSSWALQPDGRILLAGPFTEVNGVARTNCARLNPDGTVDLGFAIPPHVTFRKTQERWILALADGRSLDLGWHADSAWSVFRHQPEGTYDLVYERSEFATWGPSAFALQPDGQLLLSLPSPKLNGVSLDRRLVRLDEDGVYDAAFPAGAPPLATAIGVQPGGGMILVGDFTATPEFARSYLARLNPDGSLDESYAVGSGPDAKVQGVATLPDGRALIWGDFTMIHGVPRQRVALLEPDGSLNESFGQDSALSVSLSAAAVQPDGLILVAGIFSQIGGVTRAGLARVFAVTDARTSPPAIVASPLNRTGEQGQRTAFTVTATGALPLNYQWLRDGAPIDGATNAALALANLSPGDAGEYAVVVANPWGEARSEVARLSLTPARPRAGRTDPAYQAAVQLYGTGVDEGVLCLAGQPDGKAIIGGDFFRIGSTPRGGIARLNAEGTLDTEFGFGVGVSNGLARPHAVRCIALQPDGKVLIGGEFTSYERVLRVNLARLHSDGSLDASFEASAITTDRVQALALQPDGRILVGGWFPGRLLRLTPRGVLDSSFAPKLAWPWVRAIAVQPDGKIVVCGDNAVARLDSDGSLDAAFGGEATLDSFAWDLAVGPDGDLFAGGCFTQVNGQARRGIARWSSAGQLAAVFDPKTGASDCVTTVVPFPGGRLLAAGSFGSYQAALTRGVTLIEPNGDWARDFRPGSGASGGLRPSPTVNGATLLPDDSILLVGNFRSFSGFDSAGVVRLVDPVQLPKPPWLPTGKTDLTVTEGGQITLLADARGSIPITFQWLHNGEPIPGATSFSWTADQATPERSGEYAVVMSNAAGTVTNPVARITVQPAPLTRWRVDPSFAPEVWRPTEVTTLARQPDGRLLVGGEFTHVNDLLRRRLVRLETDGSVDESFDPGEGPDGRVTSFALQPDGKIVVGGYFERVGGVRRKSVARLNADGRLDPTFNLSASGSVEHLALLSNGQLLVAGRLSSNPLIGILRVNPDGSLDGSFDAPALPIATSIAVERTGQILGAGGGLRIVTRLNPDGSFLQTFGPDLAYQTVLLLADDRILAAGRGGVFRLASDGTLDPDWQSAVYGGTVRCLALQADGKILTGGDFVGVGTELRRRLARLHPNGTLDLEFDARIDPMSLSTVNAIQVVEDDAIVVGGSFTQVGETSVSGLTRLLANGRVDAGFSVALKCSGNVRALAALGPTNLLVAGEFLSIGGEGRARFASLSPNGTLNPEFKLGTGFDRTVNVIHPFGTDATNQVIVGGDFTTVNGVPSRGLVSLRNGTIEPASVFQDLPSGVSVRALDQSPEGSLIAGGSFGLRRIASPRLLKWDSQFRVDLDGTVEAVASLGTSSCLIGGSFNRVARTNQPAFARIKPVSTDQVEWGPDPDFPPRFSTDAVVFVTQIDADGQYLVGGDFAEVSGTPCGHLIRLHPSGTLDPTFRPGAIANDAVRALLEVDHGRWLVAGHFTELGGQPRHRLARILHNGDADPAFDPGLGANGPINALLRLADGTLVVGGEFTTFDGVRRNGLARLVPDPVSPAEPPTLLNPRLDATGFTVTVLTHPGTSYQLEYQEDLGAELWTAQPPVQGDGTPQSLHDPNPTGPRRFYRVQAR